VKRRDRSNKVNTTEPTGIERGSQRQFNYIAIAINNLQAKDKQDGKGRECGSTKDKNTSGKAESSGTGRQCRWCASKAETEREGSDALAAQKRREEERQAETQQERRNMARREKSNTCLFLQSEQLCNCCEN